jgi:RNA polymerase sigma-70 factor (ECF subfamily)
MHQAKEELLVLAAQQGNNQAFTFLCRHYQTATTRFAYKLCNDPQIVEEAMQNTWLKLAKNLHQLKEPGAFKNWLFKAVRWSVYDLMRQVKNEQGLFSQESCIDEVVDTEKAEKTSIQQQELSTCIKILPEIDQQVIHLFYLEELRISQIADVLQVPIGTVKSRLNRARTTLRNNLEENNNEH